MRSVPEPGLTFLRTLPPAAVATTAAVVAAPVGLEQAARALGASRWQVTRDAVIPSALPQTFTGIRLAVGMAYLPGSGGCLGLW
ncbi:ABC-type nitrate/sulfonate/bicarbonate transport system permease component [Mycobacteroides chelonae]|nr:ABC-type nitrate/sulfonate/bicarbonate transport system permease component [Mycobacteroides chelonae]